MLTLGIETSSSKGSLALVEKGQILKEKVFTKTLGASNQLIPALDRLLKECRKKIEDLRGIAVGLGPGSYTGLRVGMAAAKGLAVLNKIPIVGIPSMDALVQSNLKKIAKSIKVIAVVIDARREEHYLRFYKQGPNGFQHKGKVGLIPNSELDQLKKQKDFFICGPDWNQFFPKANGVALLGAEELKKKKKLKKIEPIYIRPFIGKKTKEQKLSCLIGLGQK